MYMGKHLKQSKL